MSNTGKAEEGSSTGCRYAVVWDDQFPTTLHDSIEEARKLLRETEEKNGTDGRILTVEEYLGR